jgi:hypothetical protein
MANDEGWSLSDKAKEDFEDMRVLVNNITVSGAASMRKTKRSLAIFVPGTKPVQPPPPTASLPVGQYQYQTYQMVAQNEAGWDFDSLHPPVI